MWSMFRWPAGFALVAALIGAALYFIAGKSAPPRVAIEKPDRVIGQNGSLEVTAEAPGARFTELSITLEQNGRRVPLYTLTGDYSAKLTQLDRNRIHVSRPFGKKAVPQLEPGAARIIVTATRPSFLNLRKLSSRTTKDIQVRLEPPRVVVVSTHHYLHFIEPLRTAASKRFVAHYGELVSPLPQPARRRG